MVNPCNRLQHKILANFFDERLDVVSELCGVEAAAVTLEGEAVRADEALFKVPEDITYFNGVPVDVHVGGCQKHWVVQWNWKVSSKKLQI